MSSYIWTNNVPPHTMYAQIPTFEARHPIFDSILQQIGQIFVTTGVDTLYAIESLHCHWFPSPNQIPVYETTLRGTICRLRDASLLSQSTCTWHSLLFNDEESFQPFEFELGPSRQPPNEDFLHQLRDLIRTAGLEKAVALVPRPTSAVLRYEVQDGDSLTFVSGEGLNPGLTSKAIVTGWMFNKIGDRFEVVAVKKCVEEPSGLHTVKSAVLTRRQ